LSRDGRKYKRLKVPEMLLTGYAKEVFRPTCNPGFESVHCIAHLEEDISEALPYLNALLGGTEYFQNPPEMMLQHYGKIIKVSGKEIAVNALEDEAEADRILLWLKDQINEAWENRENITPQYEGKRKPKFVEILKLLPRTNCKKCGRTTCMVFAAQMVEGGPGAELCPDLPDENRKKLTDYLAGYDFD
jgi:ArsR family metal-binding transcriptional regulator